MKTFKELLEQKIEKGLNKNAKIVVKGVKGMNSKKFIKKFKNMAAYEKWSDSDAADDFEVYEVSNE